jgi:cell division protein ZapA (FtsZ GTPase activity inhibitor)
VPIAVILAAQIVRKVVCMTRGQVQSIQELLVVLALLVVLELVLLVVVHA